MRWSNPLSWALMLVTWSMPAGAQTDTEPAAPVDVFIVGWQVDRFTGAAGGGGSLDWVRTMPDGPVYTGGVAAFGVGPNRWAFGRVGAVVRPTARVSVGGSTRLGRGVDPAEGFRYLSVQGELGYRLNPRLIATFSDEYLDVGDSRGQLLKFGGVVRPARPALVSASYATSAGGNLGTQFLLGRLDLTRGWLQLFGGGSVGRTTPEVINVGFGVGVPVQRLRQYFMGVSVPIQQSRLTVAFDRLALGSATRTTLTFTLRLAVRP